MSSDLQEYHVTPDLLDDLRMRLISERAVAQEESRHCWVALVTYKISPHGEHSLNLDNENLRTINQVCLICSGDLDLDNFDPDALCPGSSS